jgi:hypothetical protein
LTRTGCGGGRGFALVALVALVACDRSRTAIVDVHYNPYRAEGLDIFRNGKAVGRLATEGSRLHLTRGSDAMFGDPSSLSARVPTSCGLVMIPLAYRSDLRSSEDACYGGATCTLTPATTPAPEVSTILLASPDGRRREVRVGEMVITAWPALRSWDVFPEVILPIGSCATGRTVFLNGVAVGEVSTKPTDCTLVDTTGGRGCFSQRVISMYAVDGDDTFPGVEVARFEGRAVYMCDCYDRHAEIGGTQRRKVVDCNARWPKLAASASAAPAAASASSGPSARPSAIPSRPPR